jgi:ABC-2 type transport system permease protein
MGDTNNKKTRSQRLRYGSTATIFTIIVVVLAVVLNVLVTIHVEKYDIKFDMTAGRMYDLTEDTVNILNNLDEVITINVFSAKDEFLDELNQVFIRYEKYGGGKIALNYYDPYLSEALIDQYREDGIMVETGSVVVEGKTRIKVYSPFDFYDINFETSEIKGFLAEQVLTSAIQYIVSDYLPTMAFSIGHDEKVSSTLRSLFERNNFNVENIFLASADMPDTVEIYVIAAPTKDFTLDEIDKLDGFMLRGGKVMVFLEPSSKRLNNLQAFLEEWGIGIMQDIVFESESYVFGSPANIQAIYTLHDINAYFEKNRIYTIVPNARAMERLFEIRGGIVVRQVLTSSKDSYAKSGLTFDTTLKEEGDREGPFPLAITATMDVNVGNEKKTAKIFAMGSRSVYAPDVMLLSSYGNTPFLSEVIKWCSETKIDIIDIPARGYRVETLSMLPSTIRLFGMLFVVLVPLTVFGMGVFVWFRRRHL